MTSASRRMAPFLLFLLLAACGADDDPGSAPHQPPQPSAPAPDAGTPNIECKETPFACGKSEPRPASSYRPPRFRLVGVGVLPGAEQISHAHGVNSHGQIAGTAYYRDEDRFRTYAFRFSEAGGLEDLGEQGASSYGLAINADGLVLGYQQQVGPDRTFLTDGTTKTFIGDELTDGTARGWALNDSGTVAGACEFPDRSNLCVYVPGSGWHVSDRFGSAMALANDGTHTGISRPGASGMYVMTPAGTHRDVGPRSAFESTGYGISPNGRWVVGQHYLPRVTVDGAGVLIDLTGVEPPRLLEDADMHPWRDLYLQPLAVNDAGFAVGIGDDWRGNGTGFLYDPRIGKTFDLNDLVDPPLPSGHIGEARAISNNGFVAVTVNVDEAATMAAVLVPLDEFGDAPPPRPLQMGAVRYEAKVLPQDDALPGQEAVAIDDGGRIAVHEPYHVEAIDFTRYVTTWRDADGASSQLFPAGELSGDVFAARASGNGNLVATGWVRDEFSDMKYYRPFLSIGGADFTPAAPPEWAVHLFGYGVDDAGNLLAQCLTPDGYVACTRDPQGAWVALFLGRPHAFAKNGLVGGETATDAVIADAENLVELGLGPGAAVYALSRDGRYAAGVAGHLAFAYDRETRTFDWLPDFAGDPATVGRVVPRAVNNSATVVGVAYEGNGRPFAFSYDARAGRFVRLQEHVGALDLHLTEARDVNDRGDIAANAIAKDGRTYAVRIRPLP